jgi:hypothetical protein
MKFTREYMAGLFDGEGCVNISRCSRITRGNKHTQIILRCFIVNTNQEILRFLKLKFGGSLSAPLSLNKERGWKPFCSWKLCYDKAAKFLEWILPSCFIKREQIILALDFHKFQKLQELSEAVAALKASLLKQYGTMPAEIVEEFSAIEAIVNEAAEVPADVPGPEAA